MLLQRRQRVIGEIGGRVVLLLGLFLVLGDVLLVVGDHLLGERLVEVGAGHFRHLVVHGLLLGIGLGRWRHAHLGGERLGLFVRGGMIGDEHLAVRFHIGALAVLLRKLAHLDFR